MMAQREDHVCGDSDMCRPTFIHDILVRKFLYAITAPQISERMNIEVAQTYPLRPSGTSCPLLINCICSSWLTHCKTSRQDPFRLLPSVTAISSKALIASMFFVFISPRLLRNVNLARVVTNALRSSSRSKKH